TRILIVEDEVTDAEGLKKIIRGLGYEVAGHAVTAEDAVSKAMEVKPDLILMDIMLKGDKTGIDAAQEIMRKNDIPVIYLTAYSDVGRLASQSQETGSAAYIVKPVNISKLAACIKLILLKKMQEKFLEEKIKELEQEKNPEKRNELKRKVNDMKD
ncbi:unnamed protein product, partial [marine sediment metagenome]